MLVIFFLASLAADFSHVHLEIGTNNPLNNRELRRSLKRMPPETHVFMFEPNPRWLDAGRSKEKERPGLNHFLPVAAWIRNETLDFNVHDDANGAASSLLDPKLSIYKMNRTIQVQAIDLADWISKNVPANVRMFSARIDIEGGEYVVMRHLIHSGQACRFDKLIFEGHALYHGRAFGAFRAFEVVLPWLLGGCAKPPSVKIEKYYGTPNSVKVWGKVQKEPRIDWEAHAAAWCQTCPVLDNTIDPHLGLLN